MDRIPLSNSSAYLNSVPGDNDGQPVIVLPGGGYGIIAPGEAEPIAEIYAKSGFDAYVLHYTVTNDHGGEAMDFNKDDPFSFPPLADLAEAMAVISKKRPDKKIILAGYSAGGHLGFYYSVLSKPHMPKAAALVLCYPAIWYKGYSESDIPKLLEFAADSFPPLFLVHGLNDNMVDPASSLSLTEAMRRLGLPFECHFFADMPHAQPEYRKEWYPLAIKWLNGTAGAS